MPDLNPDEQLWQSLRDLPTELQQEQVMTLIGTLPSLPIQHLWKHTFTFKAIVMNSVVIMIAVTGYFLLKPVPQLPVEPEPPVMEQSLVIVETQEVPPIQDTVLRSEKINITLDSPSLRTITPLDTPAPAPIVPLVQPVNPGLAAALPLSPKDSVFRSDTRTVLPPAAPLSPKPAEPIFLPEQRRNPVGVLAPEAHQEPLYVLPAVSTAVPDSVYEVKRLIKLRKTLLKSLLKDQFIRSRRDTVRMLIPAEKIVVNGQALPQTYFIKYTRILKKHLVYMGPHQRLMITPSFIAVGQMEENDWNWKGTIQTVNGGNFHIKSVKQGW